MPYRSSVKLPLDPLADRLSVGRPDASTSDLAAAVGLDRGLWCRYANDGVSLWVADRLATKAGLHVADVWPDFYDEAYDTPRCVKERLKLFHDDPLDEVAA